MSKLFFVFDYMFHVLMSGNVQVKKVIDWNCPAWCFLFNDSVQFIFDEHDIRIIKEYVHDRKGTMSLERAEEYERFFSLCV